MKKMKWSGSGFHDLLCWGLQTTLVLAWLWLNSAICQNIDQQQCQQGMTKSATKSIYSMIT
jgi:hypothetical protein